MFIIKFSLIMNKTEAVHIVKEKMMLLKYYRFSLFRPAHGVVSLIDDRCHGGGLMDKLCGAVSGFALSQAIHSDYFCSFSFPFALQEYLSPSDYDWRVKECDVSYSISNVCVRILWGEESPHRLFRPDLWGDHQFHIYANRNYVEDINRYFGTSFCWETLFKTLFKPCDELQRMIEFHRERIGGEYVCCTFRFQSLLGDFKEYDYPTLPPEKRSDLIMINRSAIKDIRDRFGINILVTSDSGTFLDSVRDIEGVFVLPGRVVHLDCSPDEKRDVYLKSFLDFYMISLAKSVFCIGTKEMFTSSSFPMYAARLNGVPFERIIL